MRYDKPLLAVLAGFLATIPYEIITRILVALGIGKFSVYNLASLIITLNRPTFFVGLVSSMTVGGTIAVIFYYLLRRLGPDYLILKSLVTGIFAWVIMESVFVWIIEGPKLIQPRPINDYFIHFVGALVYGLTLGLLFSFLLKMPIKTPPQ